jgi:hypothetical protein
MTTTELTLELHHNYRTIAGLYTIEDRFVTVYGFTIRPGAFPGKDIIEVTLSDLDFGRYDAEGDAYIVELLNIVPGDLIYAGEPT